MSAPQQPLAPPASPQPPDLPRLPSDAPSAVAPVVAAPSAALTGVPRTMQELSALRARREELSRELVSASSRRNALAQRLRSTVEGADRTGIEQRLQFLDRRILQLESDIAVTGQQLTAAPANLLTTSTLAIPGGRTRGDFAVRGVMAMGSLFTLLVFAPLAFAAARLMWRRATHPHSPREAETVQRLARLETAVDTIAVEMERVAEGQRFLTRLLAESTGAPGFPKVAPITESVPVASYPDSSARRS